MGHRQMGESSTLNRRMFLQLSTGAMLSAASHSLPGAVAAPTISSADGVVRVMGPNYSWEYAAADDTFQLRDASNRVIVSGRVQPAVVVSPAGQWKPGSAGAPQVEAGRVTLTYNGVNGGAELSVSWRFDAHGIWTDPITYKTSAAEDVVSLHYFPLPSSVAKTAPLPSLHASYLVVPGISEGPAVSPIIRDDVHFN